MAQQTKQQLAINAAIEVASLLNRLALIQDEVNSFITNNTNNTYDTYWAAFPTAAIAADGTTGTADGSPTNTHPITVPAGSPLLVTRNDLLTAVGCSTNFQSYMTGVAITTQTNTPRKFADLLNK